MKEQRKKNKESSSAAKKSRKDKGNGLWGGALSFFGCVDPWI